MPARLTRKSILTNVVRTMEFKQYTQEEFDRRLYAYTRMGATFEEMFPDLSLKAMQFIIDGTTDADWKENDINEEEKRRRAMDRIENGW